MNATWATARWPFASFFERAPMLLEVPDCPLDHVQRPAECERGLENRGDPRPLAVRESVRTGQQWLGGE